MMQQRFGVKMATILCGTMLMSSCHDVVVKVSKKPSNVNLSSVQTGNGNLNLDDSKDFLKQLDSLKGVAADFIVKQLAQDNYRAKVRISIRKYREFLVAKASAPVKIDDSFYKGANACRKATLNFNMNDADDFLGLILETAVLAKIGEVSAGKLSTQLSQQIAAISQLILLDMGINIKGSVTVDNTGGVTTTTGKVDISLSPINGETIDDATKAADKDEVLSMSFSRTLADKSVGTFNATIDLTHRTPAGVLETLEGVFVINRTNNNNQFDNLLKFTLGIKGGAVNYARTMDFSQVAGNDHQIQLIDTLNPGSDSQAVFTTTIDIKALTQCKGTPAANNAAGNVAGATASDGGDGSEPLPNGTPANPAPAMSPASPASPSPAAAPSSPTSPSMSASSAGSSPAATAPQSTSSTSPSSGAAPTASPNTTATSSGGKGSDADFGSISGGKTPTQTPTQTPVQQSVK